MSEVPSGFLPKLVPPQLVLPPLALAEVEKANVQEGEVSHDQEQGRRLKYITARLKVYRGWGTD